ncbi:hypothetical protein [Solitalea longa]|nr:hypothetical protein [Solitalea longa]
MTHRGYVVLESLFLVMFLAGPLMKITERLAVGIYHTNLEPLGILGLYICGIGTLGLIVTLLIHEWYYPDIHKPKME